MRLRPADRCLPGERLVLGRAAGGHRRDRARASAWRASGRAPGLSQQAGQEQAPARRTEPDHRTTGTEGGSMKVYISTDFEGVAGIVDWDQIMVGSHDYELGRRLLLGELNAAIDGAREAGATEFVVNDSHSSMRNLEPDLLHGAATLITGKHKPMYMMEGLDSSFDAIFFLGYHGSIGASHAVLSHSYNPRAIWEARINGQVVGETAINALVAAHYGVPIALITGDSVTIAEAEQLTPAPHGVAVKQSISRFAAESLHPEVARERIHEGATRRFRATGPRPHPSFPSQP